MMKEVLINMKLKCVDKIVSREKTIEVKEDCPNFEPPFKVYIHKSQGKQVEHLDWCDITYNSRGKVIGEFICDKIDFFFMEYSNNGSADLTTNRIIHGLGNANSEDKYLDKCLLTHEELCDCLTTTTFGYGWHITKLKIYDKPKKLSDFRIKRVSQNCCYVEVER